MHAIQTQPLATVNPLATSILAPAVQPAPIYQALVPLPAPIFSAFVSTSSDSDVPKEEKQAQKPSENLIEFLDDNPQQLISTNANAQDHLLGQSSVPIGQTVADLTRSGSIHHIAAVSKQKMEAEIQAVLNTLWTFQTTQEQARAVCGCANEVSYSYSYQTASLNEANLKNLRQIIKNLYNLNVRGMWLSLFEQTVAEIGLEVNILNNVETLETAIDELKSLFVLLVDLLRPTTIKPLSTHAAGVVRGLTMIVGLKLLDVMHSPQANAVIGQGSALPNTLFDLGDILQSNSTSNTRNEFTLRQQIMSMIIDKLLENDASYWAKALVHPTVSDIRSDWLLRVLAPNSNAKEIEITSLLAQVSWDLLPQLTLDQAKQSILLPIQNFMETAVAKNYLSLLTFLSKILLLTSHYFPVLTVNCVAILLRSPWPAKMACQPVLQLMNWSGLNVEETITLFGELYHFFQIQLKPIEFVQSPWQTKVSHRDWFVNYLLTNHAIVAAVYQVDATLGQKVTPIGFPILNTFTKLAMHYRKLRSTQAVTFDLEKLVVSELFYIAFVHRIQQGQGVQIYSQLKNEAFQAMVTLVNSEPQYLSHIITELGATLAAVNPDILKLLDACQYALDKWIVDDASIHIISYFLNRKSMQPAQGVDTIDYSLTVYLCTDNKVQFSQVISELAANIATRIITSVNWMNCMPAVRAKAILSVVAGKHVIATNWLIQTIKKFVEKGVISASALDPQTTFKFLNLPETKVVSLLVDEFSIIKLLLAISLVDMSNSAEVQGQYNVAWAKQWGVFTRLHRLITERADDASYRGLIAEVTGALVIALSKKPVPPDAWNDITNVIGILCNTENQALIGDAMVASLTRQVTTPNFYNCLNFWARLLIPLLGGKNRRTEELVNQFLHGAFIQQANFSEYINLFLLKILPFKDIQRYVQSNVPWVAYLALFAHDAVPAPRRNGSEDAQIKNSNLGNWKDMALYLGDAVIAIPFWEQFFRIYFATQERHNDNSYFSPQTKQPLSDHFMQMASRFQGDHTKPFYQMYYSFTTWAKDVVFATNLLKDRASEVFQTFVKLMPPTFPLGSGQQTLVRPPVEAELTHDERTNFLVSLLPPKTPAPTQVFDEEKKRFEGFRKEFNSTLKALLQYAKSPEGSSIPAIEDLSVCLSHYYEVVDSLWVYEKAFLNLIEQQYQNTPQLSSVAIPCYQGEDCVSPAVVQLQISRITSPYPNIREDLTVNRQQFTRALSEFFEMSRTVGNAVVILDHVKNHLLLQETAEAKFMAQVLFFKLLPLILNQEAPPFSPIHTALIRLAVEIGEKYIKPGGPHPQLALLKMVLEAKKVSVDVPSPVLTASNNNLMMSTRSSGDFGLKTLSLSQSTNEQTSSVGAPVFTETRQDLFKLISPSHFLNAEGWPTYIQMLNMFLSSSTELSLNEEKIIAEQFEFAKCISILLASPNGTDELYRMFELSLKKPGLVEIATHLFNQLINFDFPNNIARVLAIALKQTGGNNSHIITIIQSWSSGIIQNGSFTLDLATTLLKTLRNVFPLPTEHANAAVIHIFKQVLLFSPFKSSLLEENQHIFQHPPALAPSASWDEVERITKAALTNNLPVSQFDSLLNVIAETIFGACPKLIDRFWYLYIDAIAPYVVRHQDVINYAQVSSTITRLPWQDATFHIKDPFVLVHMSKHSDLIPQIVQAIFVRLDWNAFAKSLAPVSLPLLTGEEAQEEVSYTYRDKHVLHFLKMLMDFNLMAPEAIPESLRRINFALSNNPNAIKDKVYMFDWRKVPLKEFREVFTGETLIRLVKDVKMNQDPSKQLIENLLLLKDIAKFVGHAEPMFACFREAKSILFFHMQSVETEEHWLIPYQDQIKIVGAVLVPLTTQYYEIQENEDHEVHLQQLNSGQALLFEDKDITADVVDYEQEQEEEPMAMLLSCIKGTEGEAASWKWGNSYLAPLKFANSRLPPQIIPLVGHTESDKLIAEHNQQFESFHEKLYSLIVHYSNSVPSFVCLKVFNYAFTSLSSKPKVLVQIIENTLHNYFGASLNEKTVFKHAAIAFKFPIRQWTAIAQAAAENSCALTLRLLFEKMKLFIHSLKQTGQKAPIEWSRIELFYEVALEFILKFKPHETKSFDMLCLWFFAIEMISEELTPVNMTNEIIDLLVLLRNQWQLYSGSVSMFSKRKVVNSLASNPRNIKAYVPEGEAGSDDYYKMVTELAAKSCELYLLRTFIYRTKKQNIWPIDRAMPNENSLIVNESDLKKMYDSLMNVRNKDRYNRFGTFFTEMESILAPLNDIANFEQSVIRTLAAIAPYLANMVPVVDESEQRIPQSPIMRPLRGSTNELRKSVNLSLSNNNVMVDMDNGVPTIDEPLLDFGNLTMSGSSSDNNSAKNSNNNSGPSSNHELDMIFGTSPPVSNAAINTNNSNQRNQSEKLIDFDL